MYYLKMLVDGETKEQLAQHLVFLLEYIQEGAICGSGNNKNGSSWFFIKEQEEPAEKPIPCTTPLRVKISARGEEFEHLAMMLEEFRWFIALGCCGGMTGLPHGLGSASYIVSDREKEKME